MQQGVCMWMSAVEIEESGGNGFLPVLLKNYKTVVFIYE